MIHTSGVLTKSSPVFDPHAFIESIVNRPHQPVSRGIHSEKCWLRGETMAVLFERMRRSKQLRTADRSLIDRTQSKDLHMAP